MSSKELNSGPEGIDGQLRRSFESWDAGDAPGLWERIDEELSVENVWKGLSDSLETEEKSIDSQLRTGFENWEPGSSSDIWTRLDESLSVEKVWLELNESLETAAIRASFPWLRIAAACVLVLFFARNVSNESPVPGGNAVVSEQSGNAELAEDNPGISAPDNVTGKVATPKADSYRFVKGPCPSIAQNQNSSEDISVSASDNVVPAFSEGDPETASETDPSADKTDVASNETGAQVEMLPYRRFTPDRSLITAEIAAADSRRYHHFLVQAGTQLSYLNASNQGDLSTSKTRPGIAADLAYRQRFGNLQLTGAIGLSQFEQQNWNYVNARYTNTSQKINMAQLSLCLGYNYKRFHFYGGPVLSNVLTGLEFNNNTITSVYNFRTIEPGITAGVDYNVFSLGRSGHSILLGSQYQYIPDNRLNNNLGKIHGIRLQAKFSF